MGVPLNIALSRTKPPVGMSLFTHARLTLMGSPCVAREIRDVKQRKSEMITFLKSYLEVPEDEAAKSYEFLVSHMPDHMIVDDAVISQAMEFAASSLKLKPDAVPDIAKVRDWSYARAATK